MNETPNSLHIFEMLARQNESMLMSYLLSLIADPKLAEDVAQQTFLIAYRKIHSLKNPSAFSSWLRGIARLEAFAALRHQGREFPVDPAVIQQMDEVYRQFEEQLAAETWEERFQLIERCYEQLPETLQIVCRLHYFENRKGWEIAEALTLSLNTVLKRLERSRHALRDCVESQLTAHAF